MKEQEKPSSPSTSHDAVETAFDLARTSGTWTRLVEHSRITPWTDDRQERTNPPMPAPATPPRLGCSDE